MRRSQAAMTGGEPITARHLYQNYFEFKPEFKLWLVANDPPRVRATDDAMWRRILVIPMNAKIPPDKIDAKLPEKLRAEWPGILCWAVRGCLNWRREGLEEPEVVKEASRKWREDVDHIRRFVQETLIIDSNLQSVMPASELISHFTQWCTRNGETPISAARLKAKLQQNYNLTHKHTKSGSEWRGVRLKR